jgi:hypothetical protein
MQCGSGDCGDSVESSTDPFDSSISDFPAEGVRDHFGGAAPEGVAVGGEFVDELGDPSVAAGDVVGEYVSEFPPGEGVVGVDGFITWPGAGCSGPTGPSGVIRLWF